MFSSKQFWRKFLWITFNFAGIFLGYFAIQEAFNGYYALAFGFVIYLLVYLTLVMVYRDAQKFLLSAKDRKSEKGQHGLAEDYLNHINWHVNRGHNHRLPRFEPKWKYQPIYKLTEEIPGPGCSFALVPIIGILIVAAIITWLSMSLGCNSVVVTIILVVLGIAVLFGYWVKQELKN